jgi:hypothetical protein
MLSHLRSCERYDEPETLPSSICLICPTSADGGQLKSFSFTSGGMPVPLLKIDVGAQKKTRVSEKPPSSSLAWCRRCFFGVAPGGRPEPSANVRPQPLTNPYSLGPSKQKTTRDTGAAASPYLESKPHWQSPLAFRLFLFLTKPRKQARRWDDFVSLQGYESHPH